MTATARTRAQLTDAVQRCGGNGRHADNLIASYEHMQARLTEANTAYEQGDTQTAETIFNELERNFARPLDELARDTITNRRSAA